MNNFRFKTYYSNHLHRSLVDIPSLLYTGLVSHRSTLNRLRNRTVRIWIHSATVFCLHSNASPMILGHNLNFDRCDSETCRFLPPTLECCVECRVFWVIYELSLVVRIWWKYEWSKRIGGRIKALVLANW